ncbi:MAG: hypothetical protein JNG88_04850 [Phycisphaerales bacterium]|nr:hypothetical protein [Phycisphaerales bacterium]
MRSTGTHAEAIEALIAALQRGEFDEAAARRLYTLGPDAVALALLAATRRISELQSLAAAGGDSLSTPCASGPTSRPSATKAAFCAWAGGWMP